MIVSVLNYSFVEFYWLSLLVPSLLAESFVFHLEHLPCERQIDTILLSRRSYSVSAQRVRQQLKLLTCDSGRIDAVQGAGQAPQKESVSNQAGTLNEPAGRFHHSAHHSSSFCWKSSESSLSQWLALGLQSEKYERKCDDNWRHVY